MFEMGVIKATVEVETIRYYKDSFGIILCSIKSLNEGELEVADDDNIVFKGAMAQPIIGNVYNVVAEYSVDPKWGGQYNLMAIYSAIDFETDNERGKKMFLSSLFTPLQIKEMYKTLPDPFKSLKDEDIQELVKIKGCGIKNALRWCEKFSNNYNKAKIFTELSDYNLTTAMVERLIETYNSPDLVVEKVKNNPYILCSEVKGIGWQRADQIAMSGGIKPYDSKRVGAYIKVILEAKGEEGYSWITPDELMGHIIEDLGEDIPDKCITDTIHDMDCLWWNKDKTKIGLKRFYDIEEKIAKELVRLRNAKNKFEIKDWKDKIRHLEGVQGWEFNDDQYKGIELTLNNNIVIIQGAAGTGKSSTVSGVLAVLKGYSVVQTALSGRAASRLQEITHKEGYTIHRLLGYPKGDKEYQKFSYNQDNLLPFDIYIVDEVSMIDSYLMYYLLRAIPTGAKVIFLGDEGQLEAIGAGNVMHDMVNSGEFTYITLNKIHRQASKSAIITESMKVRSGIQIIGKDWVGEEIRGELQDFDIMCYSDSSNTFYNIMQKYSIALAKKDFNIIEEQVIVPIKSRGDACTYKLNNTIQELYNPADKKKDEEVIVNGNKSYILRVGDKVINTQNNYKTNPNIYNGNMGILKAFDVEIDEETQKETEVMVIDFIEIGRVSVPKRYWKCIELGYAITVHKFQGSSAEHIIFGLDFSSYSLLTKELVYTGITRASKHCDLVAQTGALRLATSREGVSFKQTHLEELIREVAHPKIEF